MLKWLAGAESADHPLATLADAKEIVATLPPDDSVRASQDAVQWLESISSAGNFQIAHRYEVIELIDLALKRHGQRLLAQYLVLKPQAKFQEGLLWRAALGYWKALGDAYLGCLTHMASDKSAAATFRKKTPQ